MLISVHPARITNDIAHVVTQYGANLQPGAAVRLGTLDLGPVEFVASDTLRVTIPAGLLEGVYSVTVINPDGQSFTLPNALTVAEPVYCVYMPLIAAGE